ncbi:MAG: helix-turn-helix domain-containing protein [Propionibacterium acidifaciens]|uniref:helix-turn-helix domain-containing protein n=1 Tax=Propionibacterium acidifaciens TaxID=556499 RepID=UPI0036175E8B
MRQEELIGQRVRAALSDHRWRQSDLVRATGLDKNTVSAIVNGRQRASDATLGRIEAGLGMTPGTLAAAGEDAPTPGSPNPLADVSDMALLAELGRRLDKASGQRAGQPSRLRPVPSWADPVAARELHEPKGVSEPVGDEDFSQDPDDWPGGTGEN